LQLKHDTLLSNFAFSRNLRLYTAAGGARGGAVLVDPMKPTLKAPGIKLLKLKYVKPLSKFGFKFNLRR